MNNIYNKGCFKVLVIGNENTYNKIVSVMPLTINNKTVMFELITVEKDAIARLQHNNYDVLLLQYGFLKHFRSYNLLKMSYAMCKPSIIIHNDFVKYFIDTLLFKISSFRKKYIFSPFLIKHIYNPNLKNVKATIINILSKSNHVTLNDIYNNIVSLLRCNIVRLKTI